MNSAVLWKLVDVLVVLGVYCDGTDEVSVMEGDSVTLHTGVKADQHEKIKWFFNDTRIAEINGIMRYICTDDQCNERFRDRLKLDHQTGSLTITNTRTTDSGLYHLEIINIGHESEKTFSVTVHGVSAAAALNATKRKSVKEGESVTLELPEERKPNDLMTWYFNDTLIAEISGDQSKICSDVQCDERFRDRVKLDHQTGSLTIMNTRTTDSGLYQLQINGSIRIILAALTVNVVADSGLSPAAVAGIVVVMLIAAAAVIYYCRHRARRKGIDIQCSHVQCHCR
ncbi:uncharacterized protein LOC131529730 isoform X2 [Onychostoma macrolepis]|uniref:uncharacterized protein LOC131529730 isoform X2 n=1 Tax=Onychostoma macrolepis TaxID=369639 RepID=UPI0027297116|nr:uncharacterized protein LOC131529730 isoform X2 [Onychostoma macrolepis]